KELGLVLAGDRELAALLLDLAEKPRVLDGEGRLGGEGLQDLDDLGSKLPGHSPVHREQANHVVLSQERYRQQGPVTHPEQDVAKMTPVGPLRRNVGYLDRLPPFDGGTREALTHPHRRGSENLDELRLEVVSG